MPKVKPLGSEEMKKTVYVHRKTTEKATKADDEAIRKEIKILGVVMGNKAYYDIARMIGMAPATFSNRMRDPRSFKLYEIRKLRALAQEYGMELKFV